MMMAMAKALREEEEEKEDAGEGELEEQEEEEQQQEGEEQEEEGRERKRKRKRQGAGQGEAERLRSVGAGLAYVESLRKRGVIYVAHMPPQMTPTTLRRLLEEYGEVTRLYLAPEDASRRKQRKRMGGSAKKRYVEGWVEFAKRSLAKRVALSLNGTQIGHKKRDKFSNDMWALKYLKGFKWADLTEKIACERRLREQKLRAEMIAARRQNAEYMQLVEQSKVEEHIQQRKKKRRQQKEKAVRDEAR